MKVFWIVGLVVVGISALTIFGKMLDMKNGSRGVVVAIGTCTPSYSESLWSDCSIKVKIEDKVQRRQISVGPFKEGIFAGDAVVCGSTECFKE